MTPTTPPTAAGPMVKSEAMERTASDNSNASGEATKKRKGSRSVANLTPAQLARKRANDREAQRAIRQRTKDQIAGLQLEVAALQERNKRLEAELEHYRLATKDHGVIPFPNVPPTSQSGAFNTHTPPSTVFDENALAHAGLTSPRSSPYPGGFDGLEDLTAPSGAAFMNMTTNALYGAGSGASSPASSAHDDFGQATYIPTSMAPPIGIPMAGQQATLPFRHSLNGGETDNVYTTMGQAQFRHGGQAQQQQQQQQHMPSQPQQQPAPWPYGPPGPFYPGSNSMPSTN